jgi:hypothetical protein
MIVIIYHALRLAHSMISYNVLASLRSELHAFLSKEQKLDLRCGPKRERERATCASVCKTSIIIPVDSSTDLYLEGGSEQGSRSELLIQ